ncbi:polymorphic toxin immunity protein [Mycobacterium phage prophiT46-2]|nr:polymorphic toxin immunity protein [Mycobacterium phage prophiT46-2]
MATMNTTTTTTPVWGGRDANARAVWVGCGESPEWIAAHTDALLSQFGAAFDISEWRLTEGQEWAGSLDVLAGIVRSNPVRELVGASEEIGDILPNEGYSFVVSGASSRVRLRAWIAAGYPAVGTRLPRRRLNIELREMYTGALTSADGDAVCRAVTQAWEPAMLVLTDDPVRQLARRGNWKIGVGYRTWISDEVGEINHLVDRLTATELAGGTLISAPDDWPAERVVEAMTATLRENGLDEVPH